MGYSLQDKFKFHAHRTKGAFPKGYHMTPKEKAAYSAGWVQRAKTEHAVYLYNQKKSAKPAKKK
jgi:hypothetical protein